MENYSMTVDELAAEYNITIAQLREVAFLTAQIKNKLHDGSFDKAIRTIIDTAEASEFITSKEVESLGISRQLLHYWTKQSYVKVRAKGKQKVYSKSDILRLRIAK